MSNFLRRGVWPIAAGALLVGTAGTSMAADPAPAPMAEVANQIVVRDSASGQLRAATPDEARALQPQLHGGARAVAARQAVVEKQHASGARGARLPEEYLSYSVVVRAADGRLIELCFQNRDAADAALKDPALRDPAVSRNGNQLPTE